MLLQPHFHSMSYAQTFLICRWTSKHIFVYTYFHIKNDTFSIIMWHVYFYYYYFTVHCHMFKHFWSAIEHRSIFFISLFLIYKNDTFSISLWHIYFYHYHYYFTVHCHMLIWSAIEHRSILLYIIISYI